MIEPPIPERQQAYWDQDYAALKRDFRQALYERDLRMAHDEESFHELTVEESSKDKAVESRWKHGTSAVEFIAFMTAVVLIVWIFWGD